MFNTARFNTLVLLLLCIAFASVNLLIGIVNHYCFRTFAYDYAVYNFAFFDFAHFRAGPCTVYQGANVSFLQDHFSITLILISPFYWLFSWLLGTYTLLFIQWLFVVFGAWATYQLIALKSKDHKLGALAMLYYFFLYGRYTTGDSDCNLAIIGSAVMPAFLYFFEARKIPAAVACFLFMIFNREDYSLWLFFICICLMIVHRKDAAKLKLSAILFAVSIVFFILIFKVFIPAFENEHHQYGFFNFLVLGKTPAEAFRFVFTHPIRAVELLFVSHSSNPIYAGVKQEFYTIYLLSGGALLLFRPAYLIPFIPLLAKKMYTDTPIRWSTAAYYSVEFVSILPVFVFLALCELKWVKVRQGAALVVCLVTLYISYKKIDAYWRIADLGDSSKYNFFQGSFYTPAYNTSEVYAMLKQIPPNAAVSASGRMTPHLAFREKIYYYPRVEDAEYIVLLRHGDDYPLSSEDFQKQIVTLQHDPDWTVTQDRPDFIVFHRPKR